MEGPVLNSLDVLEEWVSEQDNEGVFDVDTP
jgi:hypothetical protein